MRILIVTTQDRFFISHICERALYLKKNGCLVAVAAQKTSQSLVNKIEELGFSFFDSKIVRRSVNPFSQLLALIRLFRIQARFKPDICFQLGAKAIFYGTLVARIFNPKVGIVNAPIGLGYVFASKNVRAKLLRPIVLMLYKWLLNPQRSRVIIENIDDLRFFAKKGFLRPQDAFCVLGAGVDTDVFVPLDFKKRNEVCTVVMASRLIKEKGVEDFVNAANWLYRHNIPVKMQLIGEPDFGNPSSISSEYFEKLKSTPSLECLGYQSEMVSYLQKAHICCLPSFYREGLPRILIEGASCGLTILTTDTIGCKEVIRDNNGFLFAPHDVKKLVELIKYLVINSDELQLMCKRSREVAVHYFDSRLIAKRTYEIIRGLKEET